MQWRFERRTINFVDAMIDLINLHAPLLANLDDPDRFQAQYKVSLELNAVMVHDLAIQTPKRLASGTADPKWCAYPFPFMGFEFDFSVSVS